MNKSALTAGSLRMAEKALPGGADVRGPNGSPAFFFRAVFDRSKADKDKRTVPVCLSSEFPVDRGDYDEVLDHSKEGCDLTRAQGGLPLLMGHRYWDPDSQVGVIEDIGLDDDRKLRGTARFSRSPEVERYYQDVMDGIRTHMSVGYERLDQMSSTGGDKERKKVRYRWMPFEGSLVPVPADHTVGVGRQAAAPDPAQPTVDDPESPASPDKREKKNMPEPKAPTAEELTQTATTTERERVKNINAAVGHAVKGNPAAADKFRDLGRKAIEEPDKDGKYTSAADFNATLLREMCDNKPAPKVTCASLGMNEDEAQNYSLLRAIRSSMANGFQGPKGCMEAEVHEEMTKHVRGLDVAGNGVLVPFDIPMVVSPGHRSYRGIRAAMRNQAHPMAQRDMNVTTFGQGGAFVQTTILTTPIEILRNRIACNRLGVQPMAGLEGNVAIPRQTGAATAYALPESAQLTLSTQAIDQIIITPHRIGATNQYTKQLLLQSSIDVENFIRDDLMKVLAIKWDYEILQGAGAADEPTGIFNTPGISSVVFAQPSTWAAVLNLETAIAALNADAGMMAFMTTPTVRATWKNIAKVGTFPSFLWEIPGFIMDGTQGEDWGASYNDGIVNGYRAAVTMQIANNTVAFGHWADAIGPAMWGGYDVVVNPYTLDQQAEVRITVNTFGDVAVRHAASFAWTANPVTS